MANFESFIPAAFFAVFIVTAIQWSVNWSRFTKTWKAEQAESGRAVSNRELINEFYFHNVSAECQKYRTACWRSARRFAYSWVIFAGISLIPSLLQR